MGAHEGHDGHDGHAAPPAAAVPGGTAKPRRGVRNEALAPHRRALAAVVVLGGCATFSPDGGMADVRKLAQERVGALGAGAEIPGIQRPRVT